jgi:hypothetical protein
MKRTLAWVVAIRGNDVESTTLYVDYNFIIHK